VVGISASCSTEKVRLACQRIVQRSPPPPPFFFSKPGAAQASIESSHSSDTSDDLLAVGFLDHMGSGRSRPRPSPRSAVTVSVGQVWPSISLLVLFLRRSSSCQSTSSVSNSRDR
jgi:hypothetical protein